MRLMGREIRYIAATTNILLFKSIYDSPQNTSGKKYSSYKMVFNKFVTAFT
jgi:hypothetical protein